MVSKTKKKFTKTWIKKARRPFHIFIKILKQTEVNSTNEAIKIKIKNIPILKLCALVYTRLEHIYILCVSDLSTHPQIIP